MEEKLALRLEPELDFHSLAKRLDSVDCRILKEFYIPQPGNPGVTSYVLPLFVEKMRRTRALRHTSYHAVRKRLEGLVCLKLLASIARTNPKVYYAIDDLARPVRRLLMFYVADVLGWEEWRDHAKRKAQC